MKAYETVYLLKWLFPDTAIKEYRQKLQELNHGNYPKFHSTFLDKGASNSGESTTPDSYWSRFQIVDDVDDIDTDAEDFPVDDSEDEDNLDIEMKDLETNMQRPNEYD